MARVCHVRDLVFLLLIAGRISSIFTSQQIREEGGLIRREAFRKMTVPANEDVQMTDAGAPSGAAEAGAVPPPSKTAKGKGKATDGMVVVENGDEDLLPW